MCKCDPSIRTPYCGKEGCSPWPKRYKSPAEPPTPVERELLEIVIEECAEVQQRATKALRFGPREVQPGQPDDNVQRMSHEIGELLEIIDLAYGRRLVDEGHVRLGREHKRRQLDKYAQSISVDAAWATRQLPR
jgi:hypothetical protein